MVSTGICGRGVVVCEGKVEIERERYVHRCREIEGFLKSGPHPIVDRLYLQGMHHAGGGVGVSPGSARPLLLYICKLSTPEHSPPCAYPVDE